ncbi:type II toxin-antitoxin system Phd/YefM family antitoxin (plasmid) [Streptomyces sp. NBC_00536]|uniref:type II toxin-antitoxin system Phd/YefM family antitoxin n=1 Tax=Streptomyces sp. NBC_00536 TaxID=2975769 RepID=UPI002E81C40E|nr:type II toxin-antitoxin system Phd/YefM family antitoxin [Streptomyces sp. NBC_00536]WUC84479.1 type II toxin-antitoxin system Phd/YefM family antitoxin [Streptomyces sp. NBC_00536]
MRESGVREARAHLTDLVADAARGDGTVITKHGRPLAVLLPPEAAEVWERHQLYVAERDRRQAVADEKTSRREAWGNQTVHPVAAVVRYHGRASSDDHLYLPEADQVPRPRRELRALVEQLRPDYRSWMVEAWYEDDPRRPSPDSARFRNTARHRYDWADQGQNNVLHLLDTEGNTLARAEYDGPVWIEGDPDNAE